MRWIAWVSKAALLNSWIVFLVLAAGAANAEESPGISAPRYMTPQDCPRFAVPQFISRPLTFAYPGIEYNIRPGIKGGRYPYAFTLTQAPDGMKIDAAKGTITWIPPEQEGAEFPVEIGVTDTAGKTATQSFRVTVTKKVFFFVSPEGDDKNPGTLEKPWKTIEQAANPPEAFTYPKGAVLYARGGEYKIDRPNPKNALGGNGVGISGRSPWYWIAYPGEKPIIDFGWSAEKQDAVYAAQRTAGKTGPEMTVQNGFGHRFGINEAGYFYFDGFEVKNTCYYTFVMWHGRNTVHFRRCEMHHLYSDDGENPSFIFTFAGERNKTTQWGVRDTVTPYRNFVIQDCYFHDRFYNTISQPGHGGAFTFYTVYDSLVEDNVIERIEHGYAMQDKDNSYGNTYRGNVARGEVWFRSANASSSDEIEICYNYIEGTLGVGVENWSRNIWLHHNSVRGETVFLYGGTRFPEDVSAFDKIETVEDAEKVIRDYPPEKRLIHFYRNILAGAPNEGVGDVIFAGPTLANIATRMHFVRWDENLVDSQAHMKFAKPKRTALDVSFLTKSGMDEHGLQAPVTMDTEGRLTGALAKAALLYGRFALPKATIEVVPPAQ